MRMNLIFASRVLDAGNSGTDSGSNAGVIAGAVVGGVVGLLCLCGMCGAFVAALIYFCRSGRLLSNQGYVRSRLRMKRDVGDQLFLSGPFTGYVAVDNGWKGPHGMTLTFHPQAGHVVHGKGRDPVGMFVASGVYSTRTLRVAFDKIYQGGSTNGERETVQVEWNAEMRNFQGKLYSTVGGRPQAHAYTLDRAAAHG